MVKEVFHKFLSQLAVVINSQNIDINIFEAQLSIKGYLDKEEQYSIAEARGPTKKIEEFCRILQGKPDLILEELQRICEKQKWDDVLKFIKASLTELGYDSMVIKDSNIIYTLQLLPAGFRKLDTETVFEKFAEIGLLTQQECQEIKSTNNNDMDKLKAVFELFQDKDEKDLFKKLQQVCSKEKWEEQLDNIQNKLKNIHRTDLLIKKQELKNLDLQSPQINQQIPVQSASSVPSSQANQPYDSVYVKSKHLENEERLEAGLQHVFLQHKNFDVTLVIDSPEMNINRSERNQICGRGNETLSEMQKTFTYILSHKHLNAVKAFYIVCRGKEFGIANTLQKEFEF